MLNVNGFGNLCFPLVACRKIRVAALYVVAVCAICMKVVYNVRLSERCKRQKSPNEAVVIPFALTKRVVVKE